MSIVFKGKKVLCCNHLVLNHVPCVQSPIVKAGARLKNLHWPKKKIKKVHRVDYSHTFRIAVLVLK